MTVVQDSHRYPYRLLAIQLELPEDAFVNQYQFNAEGDTWCTLFGYFTV